MRYGNATRKHRPFSILLLHFSFDDFDLIFEWNSGYRRLTEYRRLDIEIAESDMMRSYLDIRVAYIYIDIVKQFSKKVIKSNTLLPLCFQHL